MHEILEGAEERISRIRKGHLKVNIVHNGEPLPGCQVKVHQKRHEFLFGCNGFGANSFKASKDNEAYTRYFADLFNFATLPFYWASFEPQRGQREVDKLKGMVKWCHENNLTPKGHPLVWHEVYPGWVQEDDDIVELTRERLEHIIRNFGADIKWWDAVNEVTVSTRFNNLIGRWVEKKGQLDVLRMAVDTVLKEDPEAKLLINDFNIGDESYENLLEELKKEELPICAVGVQSHMHAGVWPLEQAWYTCERYGRFGWPVHFTELSVLSGKSKGKVDFFSKKNDWITGEEYDTFQAEYVKDFYTVLFSHPAVEAITWWDFIDGQWLGAPSGFLKEDLTPKKAYHGLHKLIKEEWWTDTEGSTDEQGRYKVDAFYGEYEIEVFTEGQPKTVHCSLEKNQKREQEVTIEI